MQKAVFFGAVIGATGMQLPRSEGLPLKVFAATFNAGNSMAPHSLFYDLIGNGSFTIPRDQILDGSEDADIVVVGVQEFRDLGENQNKGEDCTLAWQLGKAIYMNVNGQRCDLSTQSSLFAPVDGRYADHEYGGFEDYRETFFSGYPCYAAKHYNTALYVRVRTPKREETWDIRRKEYSSATCERYQGEQYQGCTIDNNKHMNVSKFDFKEECGKVVSLLVFEIRRRDSDPSPAATLCAMNTHMSFAGTADKRMGFIAGAMAEADKAGCDQVVFVGDFNTRLHCHGEEEHLAHSAEPTVKEVLGEFCKDGTCDLKSREHRDELRQFLTRDKIHCHEKEGAKHFDNTVRAHGYVEPTVPDFFPSYKLKRAKAAKELGEEWHRCHGEEVMCIANEDGHVKHNPAWTDRILLKGALVSNPSVTYERRVVAHGFKTDHAAVVAKFAFDIPKKE